MSNYPYIPAKPISYGGQRALTAVQYIVIHYTGNNGDTAKNNCDFFHNGNTRSAGAHFFVSQNGDVYQSIELRRIAYAVGGFVTQSNGAGSYYKKCMNTNSVSIELCDNASKDPSAAQIKAVRELIIFIRKFCPNAKTIIRHWDVSGKSCPARMAGKNNAKWNNFLAAINGQTTATSTQPSTTNTAVKKKEKKGEEKVTQEQFNQMYETMIAQKAKEPKSDWGEELDKAVAWAKQEGIIKGDSSGNLMMQKPLTRQEMILMLYREKGNHAE